MIAHKKIGLRSLLTTTLLTAAIALPAAAAVDVNGYKFDDTSSVAGKELKLNGAGMRTKVIIKVYAAGLYLTDKKTTMADIVTLEGPRRMKLIMARDLSSDSFGDAFMEGLKENTSVAERNTLAPQVAKFGQMFASVPGLKKGDVMQIDWIPGVGTQCELNGKKVGETVPDVAFYNALLRIWLGEHPADRSLKPALLGTK
ncbi:chalcone isomerase family protein [Massilia sp. S19_KUP03_FR1]|uniref:chalcone isomerase family protein n=1 Tax=Massilia sp. S19_KUP03_FR1 TaxID=3025503 RepID=UPI002FCDA8FF